MRFRKLRITFSALCVLAIVMLICLWVRSYRVPSFRLLAGHKVVFANGRVLIDKRHDLWPVPTGHFHTGAEDAIDSLWKTQIVEIPTETGVTLRFWSLLLIPVALIAVAFPWRVLGWRFTVRTMLTITTLTAAALGLIVWLNR